MSNNFHWALFAEPWSRHRCLLEHGAEPDHKSEDGKDLLDYCKANGLKNIEALLLSKE